MPSMERKPNKSDAGWLKNTSDTPFVYKLI
jgi:hypothetical protein